MAEVLFKVGDSGSWRDGEPIVAKPSGLYISADDWLSWVNLDGPRLGTPPPGYKGLRRRQREIHRRYAFQARLLLAPNLGTRKSFLGSWADRDPDELEDQAKVYEHALLNIKEMGYDTNWGFEERRRHGIMTVEMSLEDVEDALAPPIDMGRSPLGPRHEKRRRGVRMKFRETYSEDTVLNFETPGRPFYVPRSARPLERDTAIGEG